MLTRLRQKVAVFLNWFATAFRRIGLGPTAVSCLGLLFAFLSSLAYWSRVEMASTLILAVVFLLLSGFFDAVDGAMARLYGQVTKFGGFIDSFIDRVGEIAVYAGILLGGLCSLQTGLVALTASLMVSYVRAKAESYGADMQHVGVAERPERIIILAVATLLRQIELGMALIALLATLTIAQRILHARAEIK